MYKYFCKKCKLNTEKDLSFLYVFFPYHCRNAPNIYYLFRYLLARSSALSFLGTSMRSYKPSLTKEFPSYVPLFYIQVEVWSNWIRYVFFDSDSVPRIYLCQIPRGSGEGHKSFRVGTSDDLGTSAIYFGPSSMELGPLTCKKSC